MKTIFNKILFINKDNLFYILSFLTIISSINVSPYEIFLLGNSIWIFDIINGLRILFFFIASLLIIYKFINNINAIHWDNIKNKILLILLTSFFIQIISTFINYEINFIINEPKLVHGLFLNYSAITVCLFFFLINDEKIFLQIIFIFISALVFFYFPLSLVILFDWFTNDLTAMYFSSIIRHGTFFLETPMPRSTGIARIILLFFIISLVASNRYPKLRIIDLLVFFFVFLIISFQSRFSLFMVPIIFLLFEFLKGFKFKNLIKNYIIFLLIPYLLYNSIGFTKFYFKDQSSKNFQEKILDAKDTAKQGNRFFYGIILNDAVTLDNKTSSEVIITNERTRSEVITSGRTTIWKEVINKLNVKSFLTGFGAHSDRLVLNDGKYKNFGNNASNIYLYSILSGGIFSLILIIIFNLLIILKILKNFHSHKSNFILSTLLIITFFMRGLLENSYGYFGIDLLIVLLSSQYFFYKSKLEK